MEVDGTLRAFRVDRGLRPPDINGRHIPVEVRDFVHLMEYYLTESNSAGICIVLGRIECIWIKITDGETWLVWDMAYGQIYDDAMKRYDGNGELTCNVLFVAGRTRFPHHRSFTLAKSASPHLVYGLIGDEADDVYFRHPVWSREAASFELTDCARLELATKSRFATEGADSFVAAYSTYAPVPLALIPAKDGSWSSSALASSWLWPLMNGGAFRIPSLTRSRYD